MLVFAYDGSGEELCKNCMAYAAYDIYSLAHSRKSLLATHLVGAVLKVDLCEESFIHSTSINRASGLCQALLCRLSVEDTQPGLDSPDT